jgi:threonine/homoserine/homoserine lactone efflux protein
LPPGFVPLLGTIGGLFVMHLGVHTWREVRHATLELQATANTVQHDVLRGAVVNLLSPSPWLFWLGVGVPTLLKAWAVAPGRGLVFLLGFFALLIGGKFAVAVALALGRRWMTLRVYRGLLMLGALVLLVTGAALLREAFRAGFGV